ncbi:hypothetical protein AAE478_004772 [Parahypoxylon ruwenzoriense]
MFDVLWTDPNRELMGERIMRKEQEAKMKEKEKKQKSDCNRQSFSTDSSASSDRGFGLFGTRSRRKTPTQSKQKDAATSPSPLSGNANKINRTSAYCVRSLLHHQDDSEATVKPTQGGHLPVQSPEVNDGASSLSSPDSTLSKWTQPSAATNSTGAGIPPRDDTNTPKSEHFIQTLGPSSFVTRTTDVTLSPRDPGTDIDQLISEVHISADRAKAQTPPISELPEKANPQAFDDPGSMASPQLPQTPPPIELRNNAGIYTPGWNSNDKLGNLDAWKPPHEWDCTPNKENATPSDEEKPHNSSISDDSDQCMSPGLLALQREVRMMAAASPDLILANVKSSMGHASDATVYKELEMTKKRWMFSALQHEGCAPPVECVDGCPGSPNSSKSPRSPRILALYETQAPGGALHLTLIDPQPVSSSMGPKLRQWLFEKLLIQLEKRCRTTYPSGTFPAWLAVAKLRGFGSTITTVSVRAIYEPAVTVDSTKDRTSAESELRCLIARMLWQEIWGKHVHADRWWWEEEDIVQECIERGTYWQYSHIVAVKGKRQSPEQG